MNDIENYSLQELMDYPLPSVSKQKKFAFRPKLSDAQYVYSQINEHVFDNQLKMPTIKIAPRCRKYWGICIGETKVQDSGSYCKIKLMDKWYCVQWFVTIVAHEMVHQYQWDIDGPLREADGKDWLMSHGPSFFKFKKRLKEQGIPLKTAHRMRKWFKHQNLFKC